MSRRAVVRIAAALIAGLAALSGCLDDLPPAHQESEPILEGRALTLTSPNGEEAWYSGELHPIRWQTGRESGGLVRIELLFDGVPCRIISTRTENDGQFEWLCRPCTTTPGDYRIRITDLATDERDESDQVFAVSVLAVCELRISAPAQGGRWSAGEILEIAWGSWGGACGETVRIDLLHGDAVCQTIAEETANDGEYSWTVAPCAADTSDYALRVTDPTSGAFDQTGADLTLLGAPCNLTLTAPAGGEVWIAGESYAIEWISGGACGGALEIDLLLEGALCQNLTMNAPNTGIFLWTAAQCGAQAGPYTIRLTDPFAGLVSESAEAFTIAASSAVQLITPNGGERWPEGEPQSIEWFASGESVRLDLLIHGESGVVIAEEAPNTGSFTWTAMRCGGAEEGYAIRVTELDSQTSDASDGSFAILGPATLALTSPTGGEHWLVDEVYLITWIASAACGEALRIDLERGGTVCQVIGSGVPNSGSFAWSAAQCGLQTEGYRIRVTDLTSGATDANLEEFSIQEPCRIALMSPIGGEEWIEGETHEITWTAYGACDGDVRIELLAGGGVCDLLAARTANDGAYPWTVAPCGGHTSGYQIRITELATGSVAESGGTFQIKHRCALRVMAPRGGELWTAGRAQQIIWNPTGACGEHVLVELLCDGVACTTISRSAENTGLFEWTATRVNGHEHGYQVRVTDLASGAFDQSAGAFSIPEPCAVRLLAPTGGEELIEGNPFAVRWDGSASCGDEVRLDLLRDGALWQTIATATPNDGTHTWTPVAAAGLFRLAVTDLSSGEADTSHAVFEIRTPVFLRFTANEQGLSLTTNHPAWGGGARLIFDASDSHWIDAPAWNDCGGSVLLLCADGDGEASFHPDLGAGAGVSVSPKCTGIEVRVRGAAQVRSADLALRVSSNVSAACVAALPIATECRIHNTSFGYLCMRTDAPVMLRTTFEDSQSTGALYAIKQVEYIFRGWVAR